MIDANISLNTMDTFQKADYVTVENCAEMADSVLRNTRLQSLIIVLMFILIVILFWKLSRKEKEKGVKPLKIYFLPLGITAFMITRITPMASRYHPAELEVAKSSPRGKPDAFKVAPLVVNVGKSEATTWNSTTIPTTISMTLVTLEKLKFPNAFLFSSFIFNTSIVFYGTNI
jgi:hypothetical protein